MKRLFCRRFLGGLLVLVALFSAGLFGGCSDERAAGKKNEPVSVSAVVTERRDVPLSIAAVGNVVPSLSVAVTSRVMGEIMEVHFKEGEDVREGQLLFTVDKRPFEAALREAEAKLSGDRARLQKALNDLKRFKRLESGGYASRDRYEQALTEAAVLQAAVKEDEAAAESAALQLSYCSVRAPATGRAGAVHVDRGNIIKANDERHLVAIDALEPVYVVFSVPELHLPSILRLQAKSPPTVTVEPRGGSPETGTLTLVENSVDTRTGTIRLRASFPNKSRTLWPGQFTAVHLESGVRADALVVPLCCVLNGPDGTYVYIVDKDGKVRAQPVTLGPEYGELTVVEKGLEDGDLVVADGHIRLAPGMPVHVSQILSASPGS